MTGVWSWLAEAHLPTIFKGDPVVEVHIAIDQPADLLRQNKVRIVAWAEAPNVLDMQPPPVVHSALIDALRAAEGVAAAVAELDAEHYPVWADVTGLTASPVDRREPVGCARCWPEDGSWPCTTRLIADDLRKLLTPKEDPRDQRET